MKVTKYIPLAFVLIMAFGCENFDDFEDGLDTWGPFRSRKISDEVKNPIAVFSDFVIICDEYYYNHYNSDYKNESVKYYGIQISSIKDFLSIVKEYRLEDLKKSEHRPMLGTASCYYWKVDELKPQTTYYCRFYSEDQLGGRVYKETFSFTTSDIKFSDLVEVEMKEVGLTYASVQAKWDDAIVAKTGSNTTIEFQSAVVYENGAKITGNKLEGENIWNFLSLTPGTSYKLEAQFSINIKIGNYYNDWSIYSGNNNTILIPIISSVVTTFATPQY